jgi:diketogulonate reductase-like aldo/keto reductase
MPPPMVPPPMVPPPMVPLPGIAPPHVVPALGLGTWRMGESASRRAAEVAAVRTALEMGYRLIDTAEMYGEGGAEEVVGQALREAFAAGTLQREEVFVVSKVYPHNASRKGMLAACDASRRRLGLDVIDLYLLHWRGRHALTETLAGFSALIGRSWIHRFGVSNFDLDDLREWVATEGAGLAGRDGSANQVYYSLGERGIEYDLLPWQRQHGWPLMAYCPIDQGALAREERLAPIAERLDATPAQLALAWTLRDGGVIAIPKAVREEHLRENLAAASLVLDAATRAELDGVFPPPQRKQRLAMT